MLSTRLHGAPPEGVFQDQPTQTAPNLLPRTTMGETVLPLDRECLDNRCLRTAMDWRSELAVFLNMKRDSVQSCWSLEPRP